MSSIGWSARASLSATLTIELVNGALGAYARYQGVGDALKGVAEQIQATPAGGAYVKFIMDEGQDRIRAALPRQLRRLAKSSADTTRTTSSTQPERQVRRLTRRPPRNHDKCL